MATNDQGDYPRQYASPPCLGHELGSAFEYADSQQALEVQRWRKAERTRLLAERAALSALVRRTAREAIEAHLDHELSRWLDHVVGLTISAWWPINAELDLRPWLSRIAAKGLRVALPVVVERAKPLVFRSWSRNSRMETGFWNIPVPADGSECVPDLCLIPLVGWDADGFRLGYGGGYFDRTLAALSSRPVAIGIGLQQAKLATVFPQPHDIPMKAIITESGLAFGSKSH